MRRVVFLAGGVLLAAVGLIARSGSGEPAAAIEGPRASDLGPRPDPEPPKPIAEIAKPEARSPKPVLDLDHVALAGDHYEAPLGDQKVTLTLDPKLQARAEALLDEARAPRGAIVAMTPDGKILALAGRSTDAPKGGTHGTRDWHLATDAWGPAASVFKLVTASALVESGVDGDTKVCYHGGIRSVSESNLKDSPRDNACQTLTYGVAHSNNAIVGKLAYEHLEPSVLAKLAHDLLAPSPLGATAELALPDAKDLEFAQAAAGFTGAKLSVLGGALLAATFANGGERPEPRLVDGPAQLHRVLPEDVARAVGKMMVATCRYGSAARSFGRRDTEVAGKTGTLTREQPFYMEHSWFVGYAPADHPQIVVAVLLGNPENWHLRGHEAARKLLDAAIRRAPDRDAAPQRK